jgi:hypothetical protein
MTGSGQVEFRRGTLHHSNSACLSHPTRFAVETAGLVQPTSTLDVPHSSHQGKRKCDRNFFPPSPPRDPREEKEEKGS